MRGLYYLPNIVKVIKSRRIMLGVAVSAGKFWLRSTKGKDRLKDISVSGSRILKWILKKWNGRPVDCTNFSNGGEKWCAVFSTVESLRFT